MAITPTSSSPGFRVVRVGSTAGFEYSSLNSFANYLRTQNLVTNGEILCAEVYEDQDSTGTSFVPNGVDDTHYCIIRPVPGAGVADLDASGALDYGTLGVQLTLNTSGTAYVGNGVKFSGFRVHIGGTNSGDGYAGLFTKYGQSGANSTIQGFDKCRFLIDSARGSKLFDSGNNSGISTFVDCLVKFGATTATLVGGTSMTFDRCTFVRTSVAGNAIDSIDNTVLRNCVFANLRAAAFSHIGGGNTFTNCISDSATESGIGGFTVNTAAALLQNLSNDFRPSTAGPLIGHADASAANTRDVRNAYRGTSPDLGAAMLTPAAVPSNAPTGTVTQQGPQFRQTYTIQFSTTGQPFSASASLNPDSANPNGAVLNTGTVTLDNTANTGTATFTEIAPGNYVPNITLTNGSGSAGMGGMQAVAITETRPPIVPTQSSAGFRVVTVGTGKDYANMAAFATYLRTQNLQTNAEILCAEVYENQTITGLTIQPAAADDNYYCLIRPVPGRSVNVLEPSTSAIAYGSSGVQITADTSSYCIVSSGVVMRDFRFHITGTQAGDRAALLYSNSGQSGTASTMQDLQNCRFLIDSINPNAIESGNSLGHLRVTDSLIVFGTNSPSAFFTDGYRANILRNTFVRLGTAGVAITQIMGGSLVDNVFANMGAAAYGALNNNSPAHNNLSDNSADTGKTGMTVVAAGFLLANTTNDFRPKAAGALIRAGGPESVSIVDLVGSNRGPYPDLGAIQLSPAAPLPQGIVTSEPAPDGQTLTVTFSTSFAPVSGMATLTPSSANADGAVACSGVVALNASTNTGTASFTGIEPGRYDLTITLSNTGGINAVTGTQPVTVNGIDSSAQAPTMTAVPATAPAAPTNVVATAGNGSVTITCTVPASGGHTITSYRITASTGQTAMVPSLPGSIAMPNGTAASFQLQAINDIGASPLSASSNLVTPTAGAPTPPTSTRSIVVSLVNLAQNPQANLSALKWAWFDQATPNLFAAPTDKGNAETTDANGLLTIPLPNSALSVGGIGWLVITDSSGSPATIHNAFSGPVAVS